MDEQAMDPRLVYGRDKDVNGTGVETAAYLAVVRTAGAWLCRRLDDILAAAQDVCGGREGRGLGPDVP